MAIIGMSSIMKINKRFMCLVALVWCLAPAFAFAADKMPPIKQKPFASHHIVLQISDGGAKKQTLVLNVAGNLVKYYGPDNVDLEIVAFGPGLRLLLANNANAGRIASLVNSGDVKFDACANTLHAFTKKLGHTPKLNPNATVVPAGAARIVQLVSKGYVLIRP